MTWKIAFFISSSLLAGLLIWGCSQTLTADNCTKCTTDPGDSIPGAVADIDMELFKEFRDSINISKKSNEVRDGGKEAEVQVLIDQFNALRGFKLRHRELATMLLNDGCDAEVWAMLCVKPSSLEHPGGEIDLLFQVRKTSGAAGLSSEDDDDDYYDFTQPCPPSCPN